MFGSRLTCCTLQPDLGVLVGRRRPSLLASPCQHQSEAPKDLRQPLSELSRRRCRRRLDKQLGPAGTPPPPRSSLAPFISRFIPFPPKNFDTNSLLLQNTRKCNQAAASRTGALTLGDPGGPSAAVHARAFLHEDDKTGGRRGTPPSPSSSSGSETCSRPVPPPGAPTGF